MLSQRVGGPLSPVLFNIVLEVHSYWKRKRKKRHPNWKGRSKTVIVCRWHDRVHRKPYRLHQNSLTFFWWNKLCNPLNLNFSIYEMEKWAFSEFIHLSICLLKQNPFSEEILCWTPTNKIHIIMNYKKGNCFSYFYILSTTTNLANVCTWEIVAGLINNSRMLLLGRLREVWTLLLITLSHPWGPTKKI